MFKNHIIAFILGFILDRIIGDPYNIPHPIRYIGSLISFFEKKLFDMYYGIEKQFFKAS